MKAKTIPFCLALFAMFAGVVSADQPPEVQTRAGQVSRTLVKLAGTNSAQMTEWTVLALQTPGEPALQAQVVSNDCVKVHWPSPETNYSLVVATNRAQMIFRSTVESIHDDGTNKFIMMRPQAGLYYYQLQRNR